MVDLARLSDATDPARYGSKSSRLAALLRAGFLVPDGLCLSADGCRRLIDGDAGLEARLLDSAAGLPGPFAVRSSGLNEDSSAASFAGQFETELNVPASGLAGAVRRCAQSGLAARATAYAASRGIQAGLAAVLVQQMVSPEWAGVLFTANPVTQNPFEMVINAAEGTGDAVAAGTVTPRSVRLDRDGRALGDDLAPALLDALARAGREIARLLGEPADIEWAWRRGELHILQARPITTIVRYPPRPRDYSNVYVWTHVNFAETMPKPASPLGWSLMEYAAERAFANGLRVRSDTGHKLFETLFGRIYWNVTVFFGSPLLRRLLSDSLERLSPPARREFDRLVREGRIHPRPIYTTAQKLVLLVQCALLVPLTLARVAWALMTRHSMAGLEDRIRRRDGAGATTTRDLARAIDAILRDAGDDMRRDYLPSFLLSVLFFGLHLLVSEKLLGLGAAEALDLVAGEPDLTTQANLSLWELAAIRRKSPDRFEEAFARHLDRFGHRGPNEQDILHPRLADAPALARELIENCARSAAPPYERRRADRDRRVSERMASLSWARRAVMAPLRSLAARWLPHRENGKHYLMLAFHRIRRFALKLGAQLASEGRLRDGSDIFFITVTEIAALGRGRPLPPAEQIELRKADFHRYATVRAPLIVTSDGWVMSDAPPAPGGNVLKGDGASAGVATGRVRVIRDLHSGARLDPGEILVAPHTDPGWTPLFLTAAAVITEVGGVISHGAVVARELGLPAVVNVAGATTLLKDGEIVTVDGTNGIVSKKS